MAASVASLLKRQLSRFEIKEIQGLNDPDKKSGGEGSFGSVYEVTVNGVPRIAKQIHSVFIAADVRPDQKQGIYERFYKECLLLSGLDHPNIVKFVGVHFGSSDKEFDASLIMEKLDTDLDKYLKDRPNVPMYNKLSILLDVSIGLLYLHTQPEPIVHRDLTTGNVLLTKGLQAKIADFGVSRVLNISPNALAAQTKCPGTLAYMPPEALRERPIYGKALDVFSFGEVCLCTIHQQFAEVFDTTDMPEMPAALERGEVQILKRKKWFDRMPHDHCLRKLVTSCLQDRPEKRPTTENLKEMMMELCIEDWRCTSCTAQTKELDTQNLRASQAELQERALVVAVEKVSLEEQLEEATIEFLNHIEALTHKLDAKERELTRTKENCNRMGNELQVSKERLETAIADTARLHDEVLAKTAQVKQYKKQVDSYKLKVDEAHADTARLHDEVLAKTAQVKQYKKQTDNYKLKVDEAQDRLQNTQKELQQTLELIKTMEEDHQFEVAKAMASSESDKLSAENDLIMAQRRVAFLEVELNELKTAKISEGQVSDVLGIEIDRRNEAEQKLEAAQRECHELMDKCDSRYQAIEKLSEKLREYGIAVPKLDIDKPSSQLSNSRGHVSPHQPLQAPSPQVSRAGDQAGPNPPVPSPRKTANPGQSNSPPARRQTIVSSVKENILLEGIDQDIKEAAGFVIQEGEEMDSMDPETPFNPNLICPLCMRNFRLGEIQKYRKHVGSCLGGKEKEESVSVPQTSTEWNALMAGDTEAMTLKVETGSLVKKKQKKDVADPTVQYTDRVFMCEHCKREFDIEKWLKHKDSCWLEKKAPRGQPAPGGRRPPIPAPRRNSSSRNV